MKKLFTLVALLTFFLGAKAVEIVDAEVDFSKYNDISEWNFPYGWGGSESARARLSIKDGCLHFESTEATDPSWDCQFFPIGGVSAETDVTYTLHFKIKGDHAGNVSMLGFGQTPYGQFAITTDWVEGTAEYVCTNASEGQILMQCGDWVGSWDIAYLKITHEGKQARPVEWLEQLTNGDAETPWADPNVRFDDKENNYKICAWSKEKGRNMNENGGWDPFPSDIEEVDGSHVFVCHGQVADTEGDPSAWDNQFWIESPKMLKVGSEFKLHFRYKASQQVKTNTQFHHQNPSDYVHWQAIGDITFTTEWQEFDKIITVPDAATDAWSVAFNLNPEVKDAVNFYFDDLSLSLMKLDEGLFIAASNSKTGIEYDFDNAAEFVAEADLMVATVGTVGKKDTWVNELMISTVRGNDKAFKSATIKPSGTIDGDADTWLNYTDGSSYKIKLPAAGVWKVSIDTEGKQINFFKVEGEQNAEPIDIVTNPTVVVVHGKERDYKADEQEGGTGQDWDNQFFIKANRALEKGEVTVVEFDYVGSVAEAKTGTQCHGETPGAYMHWSCIGDVIFTPEEQHFTKEFTIPAEADGMWCIAFNMAILKDACDYTLKNIKWYMKDDSNENNKTTENLISATGAENFFVKEGAGTDPHVFDDGGSGISNVITEKATSGATYNLAGQRVSEDYKGIVIKNGKKYIVK